LPNASYAIRNYSSSDNPPILHRKESFVDPLYENYQVFADLTRQEEELGLLSRPEIGFKQQWLSLLVERHLRIVGHHLLEEEPVAPSSSVQSQPLDAD